MPLSPFRDDRAATARPRSAGPPLILVVDPDPDTCAMYVAGLALSGWTVDGVSDGREALAKAISYRPAVVVTETRVPCLDGFELCRLLRRDPDTQHIPIVVVTSDASKTEIARAKEAGADKVLLKPCVLDDLTRAIQTTLGTMPEQRSGKLHGPAARATPSAHSRSRLHQRGETTTPPSRPPELVCPKCDRPLVYLRSHIGGVNASHGEQWDDYECPSRCGRFQYRQRTRRLRELF